MPKLPKAPSIPKPFQRDSISIDDGSAKRTWQETPIDLIKAGDMIRDFGVVGDAEIFRTRDPFDKIQLKAVNGVTGDVRYWTFEVDHTKLLSTDPRAGIPTLFSFSAI